MKRYHGLFIVAITLLSACSGNNGKSDAYGTFESTEVTISTESAGKLIFLKALPETIMQRSILPRSKRDNHYLSKYQKRYGNTLEEVHQYYMNEQDKMEDIIRQSSLTKIILHSEEEIQTNADIAYNFGMGKDK